MVLVGADAGRQEGIGRHFQHFPFEGFVEEGDELEGVYFVRANH